MTTEKKWYVVHTYSGYEEKVKLGIEDKVQKQGIGHRIGRILIPTERVVELKRGKKKESDKKFYPGYIMVEMELDDETWHLVNNVPRVTGFVGGMSPVSLPEEEMDLILQQQEKSLGQEVKMQFEKGENLRITDGPFSNFNGYVDEVDIDHGRLKVMVSIFGRQTPVELSFYQVEKV
ncbi:transcription termination/antitermination protein NusG [Candidatus Magnetobacterium casense]|uniref:transcription termination/antitermination protein NusG n=1 Tax=Candidatus Magnetobacterium casense TaxID=1455061 RepID=UPI00058AFA9E|nr:transcription termination/antitermination protein NusG [Candidatus Magnetobacterium casensis]